MKSLHFAVVYFSWNHKVPLSCKFTFQHIVKHIVFTIISTGRSTKCVNNFWYNESWPMQIQMIPQYIRYYTFILQVCIQFHRTFFCWSNAWLILITLVNLYTRANHVLIAGHWVWLWVWYRMPPPGSEVHRYEGLASGRTRLSMEGGWG